MELQVHIRKGKKQSFVNNMALYFIHQLGLQNSRFNLTIVTKANFERDTGGYAASTHTDKDIVICFDSKLDISKMMTAMAHEMVHVKQIASGLLRLEVRRGKPVTTWRNKVYKGTDYLTQPWEVLAFSKQELMVRQLYLFIEKLHKDFIK